VFLVLQDVNHQLVTESVGDEIEVTLRLAGVGDLAAERARILRVVDLCDQDDRHPMSLSGGQKQRLAIGTALASRRDIVILDEPTSGLDLAHMQGVADALRRLTDEGRTVLVATHDTELIAACADHVIALGQHMSLFTGFDPARRPR
jgi:energy-coupling factor transport system ATP-binding protein